MRMNVSGAFSIFYIDSAGDTEGEGTGGGIVNIYLHVFSPPHVSPASVPREH